jgi:hypothetical protein
MMSERRLLLRLLAATGVLQIAGRALDGWWHSRHAEFEGAAQQLEAHWLIWLAVAATIVVCVLALRRLGASDPGGRGYRFTLVSAVAYSAVAVWHFTEHSNHRDPDVAHVFLALFQIAMLAGIVWALVAGRRDRTVSTP